ncbi:MAG: hypothetical protein C0P66_004120 [Bacillaceae bacterium]
MIPDINLLPEFERERPKTKLIFLLLVLLWLLLFAGLCLIYWQTKNDNAFLRTAEQNLTMEKAALETKLSQNGQEEGPSLENLVAYAEGLTAPASLLIEHLKELLPENGYLVQYSYDDGQLSVVTDFETLTDLSAYVEKLGASEFFSDVKVNEVSAFRLEEGEEEQTDFAVVPRYEATIQLDVNRGALKKSGGEQGE